MGSKFVYNGILYQTKVENGNIHISDAAGEELHASATLNIEAIKKAAIEKLSSKPFFELISVWGGDIAHEFFTTKEDAFAVMLAELKSEFDKHYDGGNITWNNILNALKSGDEYQPCDAEFGISEISAWSRLDDDDPVDWKIMSLEEAPKILNAEFISIWDGNAPTTTHCKVNLKTREVFAIEEPIVDASVSLNKEYISFCGMKFPVFSLENLDYEEFKTAYWYES